MSWLPLILYRVMPRPWPVCARFYVLLSVIAASSSSHLLVDALYPLYGGHSDWMCRSQCKPKPQAFSGTSILWQGSMPFVAVVDNNTLQPDYLCSTAWPGCSSPSTLLVSITFTYSSSASFLHISSGKVERSTLKHERRPKVWSWPSCLYYKV